MNLAQLIDRFTEQVLELPIVRFLKPTPNRSGSGSQQADQPASYRALDEGPQDVCRLLDESEDLSGHDAAIAYSKVSGQIGTRKEGNNNRTARRHPGSAPRTLDSSDPIQFDCEECVYEELEKHLPFVPCADGICENYGCNMPICRAHIKEGTCYSDYSLDGKHKVSLQ